MTMSVNNEPHQGWDVKAETEDDKSTANTEKSDSKKKRSWKKPKDKPMRPLSAYNMFFQNQRERIVAGKTGDPTPEEIHQSVMKMLTSKTRGPKRRQDRVSHGQISFGDLARTIAAKWKAIDPKLKAVYSHYAAQEKARYKKEVVIWKEKKEREHDAARAAKQRNLLTSSSSYNDSMMSLSSSAQSTLSTSMSTNYNLSESHNSIQAGLIPEIDVVQRQQDILRQQMGFIDKQQGRMDGYDNQDSNNSGDMQFHRSMGGLGNSNAMAMNMNFNMNMNHNDAMHKEQLLLQLQQRQLQQLQQMQHVRNETSRLSNMKTTDTFLGMAGNQFGNLNSATPKHLMEQYRQLDDISQELERLKEQERQMQYKIQEHQNHTNSGFLQDNGSFGNAFSNGPQSAAGGNYNEYTASLNDAVFDSEDRQRSVRRSKSGDTDLLRNRAIGLNQMNDSLLIQRRRHSASGNGMNSAPSSFNFGNKFGGLPGMGGGNQQQQLAQSHGRRDSLAALLQIDDMRDQQRQQQQQSQQNSLAEMLQMQGNSGGNQDTMGSLFNAN